MSTFMQRRSNQLFAEARSAVFRKKLEMLALVLSLAFIGGFGLTNGPMGFVMAASITALLTTYLMLALRELDRSLTVS